MSELAGKRAYADSAFRAGAAVAAALVLVILGLIAFTMTRRAFPVFARMGTEFFTSRRWAPPDELFGALAFIWGTAFTAAIAIVIAVPISLGMALFMTQVAPPWLARPLVYLVDLLAGVPSVVFGLWGVLVLSQHFGLGRSFLTAGIILSIMITPIITSITRDVFATVPRSEKDAALALGATRWEMINTAVFPHSFGGMVGAVMLGLGRAMGETIAVALVIGSSTQIVSNLFHSGDAMPAVIANQFGESSGDFRAALIGLGVALFLLTIVVNVAARWVVARAEIRLKGVA